MKSGGRHSCLPGRLDLAEPAGKNACARLSVIEEFNLPHSRSNAEIPRRASHVRAGLNPAATNAWSTNLCRNRSASWTPSVNTRWS